MPLVVTPPQTAPSMLAYDDITPLKLDPNESMLIPDRFKNRVTRSREQRDRWNTLLTTTYPLKNGNNDPLTAALLIHALCRLEPGQMLKSTYVTEFLTAEYGQMLWEKTTVGHVLGALVTLAEFQQKHEHTDHPYVSYERWAKSRPYIINNERAAYLWLHSVLDIMCALTTQRIDDIQNNRDTTASIWDAALIRLTETPT